MNDNKLHLIVPAIVLISLYSCFQQTQKENSGIAPDQANFLKLTKRQVSQACITSCSLRKQPVFNFIPCAGSIEADPNEQAMVCVPLRGYLKKILVETGDFVTAGEPLAILEHPEYITIQQEYLATKSQYEYDKEDFTRQGELALGNATSLKKMEQAQNEFLKTEAKFFALKKQLAFLGIEPDSLKVENLITEIKLVSPVPGYVNKINGNIGMLCSEEIPVFWVTGTKNPYVLLMADSKYTNGIFQGRVIDFSLTHKPDLVYKAEIKSVTRSYDENNSLLIRAKILAPEPVHTPGMPVNANIPIKTDTVYTLPNEAIIISEGSNYVFRRIDSRQFEFMEIQVGEKNDSITEVRGITPGLTSSGFVDKGSGFLFSIMSRNK